MITRKEIEERTNTVYNKFLSDYLADKEIEEKRTIEDWQELTRELDEDKERGLTDLQKKFRQSLKQATEGYAAAGLKYSSIREEGEKQIREGLKLGREDIQKQVQRKLSEAGKIKQRTLEDIARETARKKEEVQKTLKPKVVQEGNP